MANTYTIPSTDGLTVIVIGDGAKSGNVAGATNHDTDLLLYGRGTFNWGIGIEQNLIRLTENWASAAANPNDPVNEQVPQTYGATPNKGIVKPLQGQTWFNKSNNRLYTNVTPNGSGNAPEWKVDGEFRYVSLTETDDQQMVGKLRLSTPNGQPDLYIYSPREEFGIGTGTGGANLGASSYLTFEGNKALVGDPEERVRTAYIAALHNTDVLRIAVSDRNAANSYGSTTNRIDIKQDRTEIIHDILHVGASQLSYNIGQSALTTRGWVEDHVADEISTEVTAIGDGQYLKLSDTTQRIEDDGDTFYLRLDDATARINTDGDARYLRLTGGTVTGTITQGSGTNTTVISNGTLKATGGGPYTRMQANASTVGQPAYFIATNHVAGSAFNATGTDEVRESFAMKLIQGAYTGNGYVRNNTTPPDSPFPITTDSVDLADRDTIVFEKYDVSVGGFTTSQLLILFDDYIQTHEDNGYIRTPETKMFGAIGYHPNVLLTVGKAHDTFCETNTDIFVNDIDADYLGISNGNSNADILVKSDNEASLVLDATNDSNDSIPALKLRARGTQLAQVRILADTGGDDALSVQKMNGGAVPNALRLYDDRTTLAKRLQVGGTPLGGGTGANGSIIIYAKDNATTFATTDYPGTFNDDDYTGIIFRRANGATVSSILSDNTESMIFRVPTSPSVSEIEAPFMTLTNNEMILQNMRLRFQSGTALERPDFNQAIPSNSVYYAHERSLYQLTDRRWQEVTLQWQQLFVDVTTNAAGWYQSTTRTGDPTTSTYLGLYGRTPVEFDFTDTTTASFSETFVSTNGHIHRCEVHYTIPYMILQGGTGTGSYTGTSFPVQLQYESGPNLDASSVSNVSIGNFSNIVVGELHFPGDGIDLYGRLSGVVLVPMSPGDKINIRMDDAFGRVNAIYNEYERAVIGNCTFKARIL